MNNTRTQTEKINIRNAILLGTICSIAYFVVYFGRNILSAVTPQMLYDEFWLDTGRTCGSSASVEESVSCWGIALLGMGIVYLIIFCIMEKRESSNLQSLQLSQAW